MKQMNIKKTKLTNTQQQTTVFFLIEVNNNKGVEEKQTFARCKVRGAGVGCWARWWEQGVWGGGGQGVENCHFLFQYMYHTKSGL